MSLESNAKTTEQILNDYWNLHPDTTRKQYRTELTKKWVLLKEAEKGFVDNEALFKAAYLRITALEAKITEANKIINEYDPDKADIEFFKRLREVLSVDNKTITEKSQ